MRGIRMLLILAAAMPVVAAAARPHCDIAVRGGGSAGAAAALAAQNGRSIRIIGAAEIHAVVERNEKRSNEEE